MNSPTRERHAAVRRIRRVPLLGPTLAAGARVVRSRTFPGSRDYWERHYAAGGSSGPGSEGVLASFKAEVINRLVEGEGIDSVIEFGCGDGQQLALARYPRYLGLDVSASTLHRTRRIFAADPTKSFMLYRPDCFTDPAGMLTADLALSLDVIYHLVEDAVYQAHLRHVFGAARRYVLLFTSDADNLDVVERTAPHVRHRPVPHDVARHFPEWRLRARIPNPRPYRPGVADTSFADFYLYERGPCAGSAE